MSNIKKDLLLCFLLENYCKNNDYDFTTLYNKLKDEHLINISYKPLEFNTNYYNRNPTFIPGPIPTENTTDTNPDETYNFNVTGTFDSKNSHSAFSLNRSAIQ